MPEDRYRGLAFRAHNPRWSFTPLSGDGAARHGGRFNPKGTPALYLSLSETLALAEYQQGFPHRPQPATLCAYEIDCRPVADLTDTATLEHHGIDPAALACPWELLLTERQTPPSWMQARQLIRQGCSGIIVPSFAPNRPPGGRNLVLWCWNQSDECRVRLIDDHHRLPRNAGSWIDSGED